MGSSFQQFHYFFTVERVTKHEFENQLPSKIIRVGTIPESTLELNNFELQKSTHQHQYIDLGTPLLADWYYQR